MIVDEVYAKSTRRYAQADVDRQNAESFFSRTGPGCRKEGAINETVEGSDTLFGYAAVRMSLLTGRDSLTRELDWRLPEFNCVIGQVYLQKRDNPRAEWKKIQGNRLTKIAAVEPDPALFTNWLSYDEMKPSEIVRRVMALRCVDVDPCQMSNLPDASDASYERWHAKPKNQEK